MSVVSMQEILSDAFEKRYGVAAFNMVNDLTMEGILAAAEVVKSPVIVQVSLKTVKVMGAKLIQLMFSEMAGRVSVPATLHLDHCPDIRVIEECLEAGWNSVLFDGSELSYDENFHQTKKAVAMARKHGAAVEGELEVVKGIEDGIGSEEEGMIVPLEKALEFIRETGIHFFAPAIGTAHGQYKGAPKINFERVSEITSAEPIPLVIHGGTGLSDEVFRELISRGAVKVNISTQLKITFANGFKKYLNAHPDEYNPLKLLAAVREDVVEMAVRLMKIFGSEGKAA